MAVPVLAAAEYVLMHGVDMATDLARNHRPHHEVAAVLAIALLEADQLQASLETLRPVLAMLPEVDS